MTLRDKYSFLRALSGLLDNTLGQRETARVMRQLEEDSAAFRLYLDFVDLDVDLDWACDRVKSNDLALHRDFDTVPGNGFQTVPAAGSWANRWSQVFARVGLRPWGSRSVLLSLVSVLLVTMTFWSTIAYWVMPRWREKSLTAEHDSIPPIGRVTGLANAQWGASHSAVTVGATLNSGRLHLLAGTAEISLNGGVRTLLEGPVTVNLRSADEVFLARGKLTATVAKQAIGFTVETPQAKIVDLGTEFGVSVDERGVTETQVFRGAVEIETLVKETQSAPQAKQKRKLVAGEAARVDVTTKVPQIQTAIAKPNQFIRQLSFQPDKQDHEPSAYAKYVIEKTRPVLYWNFDNPFRTITKDLVRSHGADNFSPSSINQPGPRPADGFASMSAENRAATVVGSGDVSCHQLSKKLNVPTDAYSAQIWFNSSVPFGDRYVHHFLCRGNSSQREVGIRDSLFVGGNYDQAVKAGCLGFFNGDLSRKEKYFVGRTVLDPDQWYLATFVRDGNQVRVYLNGNLEIDAECPWHGGEGDYLTFGHRVDLMAGIGLIGRFDEVAVWDRALSADEVSRLYQSAKDKLPKQP